jgi:P-type Na+/K+ transporter
MVRYPSSPTNKNSNSSEMSRQVSNSSLNMPSSETPTLNENQAPDKIAPSSSLSRQSQPNSRSGSVSMQSAQAKGSSHDEKPKLAPKNTAAMPGDPEKDPDAITEVGTSIEIGKSTYRRKTKQLIQFEQPNHPSYSFPTRQDTREENKRSVDPLNTALKRVTSLTPSTTSSLSKKSRTKSFAGYSNAPLSAPAHAFTAAALAQGLKANTDDGLTAEEAAERLATYGLNEIGDEQGLQSWKMVIRQVANAMTMVLILAMGVSFGIASYIEGGAITIVVLMNIVIGAWQEYTAEKTMDSLRSMSSPTANVVREGTNRTIPTLEVVVGDMVELTMGDTVPADIRLVEAVNFETDESLITGESLPARKDAALVLNVETGPGDRLNVAFSTSVVTKGRARGIVFATAMHTGIGSIAQSLRAEESKVRPVRRKDNGKAKPHWYLEAWAGTGWDAFGRFLGVNVGTPLQQKLSKLALMLFGIAIVCAVIVMGVNRFAADKEVIIYAVATGLSMIPASLVVVLIITMAQGVRAMAKRNVIVRNTKSLESLGSVTDICSDKTGTITQGKMVVARAWIASPEGGTFTIDKSGDPFNPTKGTITRTTGRPSEVDSEKPEAVDPFSLAKSRKTQLQEFLHTASLCNLATVHSGKSADEWITRGDPTEIAILVFASRFDYNRSKLATGDNPPWKQVTEFPFDSSIKLMSVISQNIQSKEKWIFTKGAVERIVDLCTRIHDCSEVNPSMMTAKHCDEILKEMDTLASMGLRTLALASRRLTEKSDEFNEEDRNDFERDLVFRGMVGIYDPPRPESAASVTMCHEAGIVVHMVSSRNSLVNVKH